ncbi:MAG: hypothetical protein RL095_686 [Verrucomicrobiota bacterium]|jgi:HD-like signal output (HDOD) protein
MSLDKILAELEKRLATQKIELPLLPEVAGKVMSMTSDPNADASHLSALIHRDQALATNVLKIANSSMYGGNVRIVSLQQAVSRLGMKLIREISLAASVQNSVYRVPGQEATIKALWEASVASSAFSREIARLRRKNVESAYVCGLLCGIGKPVVLKILAAVLKDLKLTLSLEEVIAALDRTHIPISLRIAEEWKLPQQVAETIRCGDDFTSAKAFEDEVQTICLARQYASFLLSDPQVTKESIVAHPVTEALNLYPEDLEELFARCETIQQLIAAAR